MADKPTDFPVTLEHLARQQERILGELDDLRAQMQEVITLLVMMLPRGKGQSDKERAVANAHIKAMLEKFAAGEI